MKSNIETIKELYQDFSKGDTNAIREKFAPDIEWIQMKGFPNGGHHIGFDAILKNVFQNFGENWTSWAATIDEYVDAGESVFAIGQYKGTYAKTGKSMTADFAHRYVLKNGKITKFTQYTDTKLVADVME